MGNWDADTRTFTPAGTPINAVRAVTRRSQANGNAAGLFFARILGFDDVDMQTEAVAVTGVDTPCIVALDPSANRAFNVSGGANVFANGCGVQVNSNAAEAMRTSGSDSSVSADSVCVTGGLNAGGGGISPTPETGCAPLPDPLAAMAPPAYGPCEYNDTSFNGGSHILTAGVYCGGIRAQSAAILTFEPGIYVLKDGDLSLNGGADIEGDEVAFQLTGAGSIVDLSGGDSVDLSAPTDGPLAGFVFYADSSTGAASSKVTGNGYTYLEGAMYFPTQQLRFAGNASSEFAASPYNMVIARTLKFVGGAQFAFSTDFASSDVPPPSGLSGQGAKLVQ